MTPGVETAQLVRSAKSPEVNNATGLATRLRSLRVSDLIPLYEEVQQLAPRRGNDGKTFFVSRPATRLERDSPRNTEDLLEIALACEATQIPCVGGDIDILMRQFPLFSKGSRKGVKAVDLVGHGGDRFWLIELKAQPGEGYGESPLRALLECLIYSAIVEVSSDDIRRELHEKFDRTQLHAGAGMMIAAPAEYWTRWQPNAATGDWWLEFERLIQELQDRMDTPIEVVDLGHLYPVIDDEGIARLNGPISAQSVEYLPYSP